MATTASATAAIALISWSSNGDGISAHPRSTSQLRPHSIRNKTSIFASLYDHNSWGIIRKCRCMSTEVDTEVSNESSSTQNSSVDSIPETSVSSYDSRREAERFVVRDTGRYQCRSCGYVYDQTVGDPTYPIAPGTEFSKLPADWRCSTCGAAKSYFNSLGVEIAGFAENQNFGFGTNTLTSGQKSLLIYGSLAFFFFLFLSGYFLQ